MVAFADVLAGVYDSKFMECVLLFYLQGLESDLAAILLLLHLLPPTAKGKVHGKINAAEAAEHVIKFMKVCPCILVVIFSYFSISRVSTF